MSPTSHTSESNYTSDHSYRRATELQRRVAVLKSEVTHGNFMLSNQSARVLPEGALDRCINNLIAEHPIAGHSITVRSRTVSPTGESWLLFTGGSVRLLRVEQDFLDAESH